MKTIFAGIGLVLAIAAFFFYTKPAYDSTLTAREAMTEYDRALQKAAELTELKQRLLLRYNDFDPAQIDRLHKLLPDHVDNVRLVLDLDNLALQHGLALENVIINGVGAEEKSKTVIGGASLRGDYDSLTMRFSTNGTYPNFVSFMESLETSLRIGDLVSLSLEATGLSQPSVGGNPEEPVYRFSITLRTYWLK